MPAIAAHSIVAMAMDTPLGVWQRFLPRSKGPEPPRCLAVNWLGKGENRALCGAEDREICINQSFISNQNPLIVVFVVRKAYRWICNSGSVYANRAVERYAISAY